MREPARLLVYVIGNPWRVYPGEYAWDKVEYVFRGEKAECRTRLSLLYRAVKPDAVVVVAQDSLVFSCTPGSYAELAGEAERVAKQFIESACGECQGCEGLLEKTRLVVAPGVGKYKNTFSGGEALITLCGSLSNFYAYVAGEVYLAPSLPKCT